MLVLSYVKEISLTEGQSPDLASLLDYAESTSSALLYLTLECLAVRNEYADRAASHIGKAMGIALTIRSLPYSASKKQVLIPKTIVREVRNESIHDRGRGFRHW